MYYWTPKRVKELKEKGYKLRLERASEQASEQANRRAGGPTSNKQPKVTSGSRANKR